MGYFRPMTHQNPVFAKKLIRWYLQNKRDLPWRKSKDPYLIWLSEIILQQTRVAQGMPYYNKFVESYPTVYHLANASEAQVLKSWQGLGYYTRARNLHHTAKKIASDYNGQFPETYAELIKLKGIGDYTASAIASFCFDKPEAVVDGNVYRVLSRIFGIGTPINTSAGQNEFKALAQRLIDMNQPGKFNQALMEFGSEQCTPRNPECASCIFKLDCVAYQHSKIEILPVKLKSKPVKKRYFNYFVVLLPENKTMLQQRKEKGIWKKLYEFPLVETKKKVALDELEQVEEFQEFATNWRPDSIVLYNDKPIVHKLSHQHIFTRFWIVESAKAQKNAIAIREIQHYAVPVLIENFVTQFFGNNQ